ncbi:MAG: hypothetical protein JWM85_215 [Acidimicrobiaceae bacterium]|nr:hypothetical protein [Acidimicrobiaceae bacterium]
MADRRARFARYLQQWWDAQLQGGTYPQDWQRGRDGDALASEFRRAAQFEVTQAAFLHRRPSPTQAREVVDRLVPAPVESDAELLSGAIVRAGTSAQRVRATTAIGAVVTVAALVLRNILRGR